MSACSIADLPLRWLAPRRRFRIIVSPELAPELTFVADSFFAQATFGPLKDPRPVNYFP